MWKDLTSEDQLNDIDQLSHSKPVVIFKHSTRCSISAMALNRMNRDTPPDNTDMYLLDLIRYRDISNAIAARYSVHHESPQVLLIKEGSCVYDESHNGISMSELSSQVNA